jgi:hypothetical protein
MNPELNRAPTVQVSVRQNLNPVGIDSAAHDRNFRKEETRVRYRLSERYGQANFHWDERASIELIAYQVCIGGACQNVSQIWTAAFPR